MVDRDRLVELRREFHRYPEPAWREFWTTCRLVEELEAIGVDELHVGPEALDSTERMAVPDEDELQEWYEAARESGAREDILEQLAGGHTGAVAVVEMGPGPTVGLRVDIDALPIWESDEDSHHPAGTGFRSENEGYMHSCGHDGHITLGLGTLEAIKESEFSGTLKVFFQPAEEVVGGGKAMAKSGHLDDVDYFFATHVGLDHPTGEIVAGIDDFLAVKHLDVEFTGAPSHAGAKPEEGRNAVQALATAVQNLYAIPRHSDGATRVNAGKLEAGTAANIVPERAVMECEVRGEATHLKDYMDERAMQVLESAAEMHGCEVSTEVGGEAPSATSDQDLVDLVGTIASGHPDVERLVERDALGGSEDATFLMNEVQSRGGLAAYVCVGTDHPGGHHTSTFDVDEASLPIGVDVLAGAIETVAAERP
ncbi:amidohydrolase [Haloarchaeobius sp. HME9146]|uniref:amidohydrolase n=1 Tax=Haloarchaeobius sp. HME9146 TaxID=2978732 RepID=UPI0021BED399|nr:amidohydrolase [Haloarchaeobius sp. HME9146]MCT9095904.1 amidohydrolase [Haloarchaeobius sp. HME9146]